MRVGPCVCFDLHLAGRLSEQLTEGDGVSVGSLHQLLCIPAAQLHGALVEAQPCAVRLHSACNLAFERGQLTLWEPSRDSEQAYKGEESAPPLTQIAMVRCTTRPYQAWQEIHP